MNGQRTNKVFVGITQPGTNIVICTAGISGKTNTIIVVKVTEVTLLPLGSVLDGNPKAGGGLRIFPDKTTPTDTIQRNRILVRARITPPVPGIPIYFKSFDVTDPTPDLTIDPNGTAGNDNLGSPQAGTLISATASTGLSGTAGVEFNVTMQPGDNFRIAAACKASALAPLTVADPSAPGYIEANGNQVAVFAGRISPMLTVWRKLYYEVDTMDRPTFAQNTWTAEWKDLTPQKVSGVGLGTYQIKLKNIKRNGDVDGYASSDAEFDGGWVRLSMPDTETGYVIARLVSYEGSLFFPITGTATIVIDFPFTPSATSGTCYFCDDDIDKSTFMAGIWGSSPFSSLDTSLMIPAYAEAYVEPTNNPAWNDLGIVFERNTSTDLGGNCYEKIGEKKSINGAPGYRTVTIGYLFQPSHGEDGDPPAGGIVTTGYTPVETIMASPYDKRTAVFAAVTAADADRGKLLSEADTPEKITVVHEVCHTIRGFGHSTTGIMKAVPEAGDTQFAPQDIRAIRQKF